MTGSESCAWRDGDAVRVDNCPALPVVLIRNHGRWVCSDANCDIAHTDQHIDADQSDGLVTVLVHDGWVVK